MPVSVLNLCDPGGTPLFSAAIRFISLTMCSFVIGTAETLLDLDANDKAAVQVCHSIRANSGSPRRCGWGPSFSSGYSRRACWRLSGSRPARSRFPCRRRRRRGGFRALQPRAGSGPIWRPLQSNRRPSGETSSHRSNTISVSRSSRKKYGILPISCSAIFGQHPPCRDQVLLAALPPPQFAAPIRACQRIDRQFSDAWFAARQVIDLGRRASKPDSPNRPSP